MKDLVIFFVAKIEQLKKFFQKLFLRGQKKFNSFLKKIKTKATVSFIPHSGQKIFSFRISALALGLALFFILGTTLITSSLIISHSASLKEFSKLEKDGIKSKEQLKIFREEIKELYVLSQKLKPEIAALYSLIPENNGDLLWGQGGKNKFNDLPFKDNSNSPSLEVLNIKEIQNELETTKEVLGKVKSFLAERSKIIENTPSIWPVEGYVISRYGQRNSPYTLKPEFHQGIDIEAFPGTPIKASAPGKIIDIKWDANLGLTILVKHKYGFVSSYSHCQRACVQVGQKVFKGELIGYVGKTGKTSKYLCYYQIKIGTNFIDPMPYLNKI